MGYCVFFWYAPLCHGSGVHLVESIAEKGLGMVCLTDKSSCRNSGTWKVPLRKSLGGVLVVGALPLFGRMALMLGKLQGNWSISKFSTCAGR